MKLLLTLLLSVFNMSAFGAYVYIRDGGTGDGSAWDNALDDFPASFTRGDTNFVADGSYGSHTFNTANSGTTLITIKKATVADHGTSTGWSDAYGDGTAIFASVIRFSTDYWRLDGQVWHGFQQTCDGTAAGNEGSMQLDGGNLTVRGVYFPGNYSAGSGHSLGVEGNNLTVELCDFYKSTYEDHLVGDPEGLLTIRSCVFTMPSPPADAAHRDIFNPYQGGGWSLLFEKNICYDIWLFGFLLQDPALLGDFTIRYNVFSEFGHATFRLGSGNGGIGTSLIYNNVFHNCKDQEITSASSETMKNNIFIRTDGWLDTFGDAQVHYTVDTAQYNMWVTGTTAGQSGTGNFTNATHNFVNTASPLGADGIPFTADDGFNITSSSAAINAGTDVSLTTDIRGTAISGNPDVGAYEYTSGAAAPASHTIRATTLKVVGR